MLTALLIVLLIFLMFGHPRWPYARGYWGTPHYGGGAVLIAVIILVLLLMGYR